jgi:hypothetical protein
MILSEKPSWLYKLVTIEKLEQIQKELVPLLYKFNPHFDIPQDKIGYLPIEKKDIEKFAPTYVEYIDSLNLLDRWTFSLIITVSNISEESIHVDTQNYNYRCYGLNLPLINCENTYTVWYEGTLDQTPVETLNPRLKSSRYIDKNLPYHEIGRLEVTNPAWVNVCIPHKPENNNTKPRAVISTRFTPEVHDIFENYGNNT